MFNFEGDPDMGYLLGLIAGDGCIVSNTVYLANVDVCVIEEYKRICSKYATKSMRTYKNEHEFDGHKCYSESHRFYAPELAAYILENVGSGAYNKKVPKPTGSKEFSLGILAGLWDTDGTISFNNRKAASRQIQVSLTSRSSELVNTASEHLRAIGCESSIYEYTKDDKPLYILNVLGSGFKAFSAVPLKHSIKAKRLDDVGSIAMNYKYSNVKEQYSIEEFREAASVIKCALEAGTIDLKAYRSLNTILKRCEQKGHISKYTYDRIKMLRSTVKI